MTANTDPNETESGPESDSKDRSNRPDDEDEDEIDRRRLIRWVAVLAFLIPVVVELLTFGGLIESKLLPGGDEDGEDQQGTQTETRTGDSTDVGVGDELLPETAATETVATSEIRERDDGGRTYVLMIDVENGTESTVELRLTALVLDDDSTLESPSSSGPIPPGEDGGVTGAWELPSGTMPEAVSVAEDRDGEQIVSKTVQIARPPIRE